MPNDNDIRPHSFPVKGIFFQYLNTAVTFIFPLILFPYLTRVLSPAGYGKIGFYESALQVITVMAMFGIPYFGIREVGKVKNDQSAKASLLSRLLVINLLLSVAGIILLIIFMSRPDVLLSDSTLTLYYSLLIFLSAFSLDWYFQAEEKFHFLFQRTLFTKILLVIAVFVFVKNSEDFTRYVLITTVIYLIIAIVSVVTILRKDFSWKALKDFNPSPLLKQLSTFAGLGILGSLYINLDTLILGYHSDAEGLGHYVVAGKIARMIIALLVSSTIVFYARLGNLKNNAGEENMKGLQQQSFFYLIHLAVPASVLAWLLAPELVTVLSGSNYAASADLLRIFSVMIFIVAIHDFLIIQVLLTWHREKQVFWLLLMAAIISLAFNIVLIRLYAETGAAIAILLTEIFVLTGSLFLSNDLFGFNKKVSLQSLSTLIVMPIAYEALQLANSFFNSPAVILFATIAITLAAYLIIQTLLFRNKFFLQIFKMIGVIKK